MSSSILPTISNQSSPASELINDNEVSITINGVQLFGFDSLEIERGIEIMPGNFTIRTTDKYPTLQNGIIQVLVKPANTCVIKIGSDTVITGYITGVEYEYTAESHDMIITGYSKCGDLVNCAAMYFLDNPSIISQLQANPATNVLTNDPTQVTTQNITNSNIFDVANALLPPFNIALSNQSSVNSSNASIVPAYTLDLGTTVYEVLEAFARNQLLLLYDDTNGDLVLSGVGTTLHTGTIGVNSVMEASTAFDYSNRFNQYIAVYQSNNGVADTSAMANLQFNAIDPGMPRYRPTIIQSTQTSTSQNNTGSTQPLAKQLAIWQMNRNAGRSQIVRVTIPNWRDANGLLWTPNYQVQVQLPQIKVMTPINGQNLVISKVIFKKDAEEGSSCELELMIPAAFQVEPIVIVNEIVDQSQQDTTPSSAPATPVPTTPLPTSSTNTSTQGQGQ
jgi:prophage tail gpP-like protein